MKHSIVLAGQGCQALHIRFTYPQPVVMTLGYVLFLFLFTDQEVREGRLADEEINKQRNKYTVLEKSTRIILNIQLQAY